MNLLLPFPELPVRSIQLWLSEEENASVTDVNASVSAAGRLWVGGGRVLAGSGQGLNPHLCVLPLVIHLDSVATGGRSLRPLVKVGGEEGRKPQDRDLQGDWNNQTRV